VYGSRPFVWEWFGPWELQASFVFRWIAAATLAGPPIVTCPKIGVFLGSIYRRFQTGLEQLPHSIHVFLWMLCRGERFANTPAVKLQGVRAILWVQTYQVWHHYLFARIPAHKRCDSACIFFASEGAFLFYFSPITWLSSPARRSFNARRHSEPALGPALGNTCWPVSPPVFVFLSRIRRGSALPQLVGFQHLLFCCPLSRLPQRNMTTSAFCYFTGL